MVDDFFSASFTILVFIHAAAPSISFLGPRDFWPNTIVNILMLNLDFLGIWKIGFEFYSQLKLIMIDKHRLFQFLSSGLL